MKARLQNVPPSLIIAASRALDEDEHVGRAPYDWRGTKTSVMRHVGGMMRHLLAYLDGEDVDPDSPTGKRHLDGIAGRLAILIDAIECDDFTDDRPRAGRAGRTLREIAGTEPDAEPVDEPVAAASASGIVLHPDGSIAYLSLEPATPNTVLRDGETCAAFVPSTAVSPRPPCSRCGDPRGTCRHTVAGERPLEVPGVYDPATDTRPSNEVTIRPQPKIPPVPVLTPADAGLEPVPPGASIPHAPGCRYPVRGCDCGAARPEPTPATEPQET